MGFQASRNLSYAAFFDAIGRSPHAHERAYTGVSWYHGRSHSAGSQHTL